MIDTQGRDAGRIKENLVHFRIKFLFPLYLFHSFSVLFFSFLPSDFLLLAFLCLALPILEDSYVFAEFLFMTNITQLMPSYAYAYISFLTTDIQMKSDLN